MDDALTVPAVLRRTWCDCTRSSSISNVLISSDWVFAFRSLISLRSSATGIRTVTAFLFGSIAVHCLTIILYMSYVPHVEASSQNARERGTSSASAGLMRRLSNVRRSLTALVLRFGIVRRRELTR